MTTPPDQGGGSMITVADQQGSTKDSPAEPVLIALAHTQTSIRTAVLETRRCDGCQIPMDLIGRKPRVWGCACCGSIHEYPPEPWEPNGDWDMLDPMRCRVHFAGLYRCTLPLGHEGWHSGRPQCP